MMGWDEAFLQSAVDTCTNLSGQITDCPLFTIQDPSVYGNCNVTLPAAIVSENVVGPVTTLPGNPAIASGPAPADAATAGENTGTTMSAIVAPTLSYSAGSSLASSDTYVPGGIFLVSASKTFVPQTTTAPSTPTTTDAVQAAHITTAPKLFSSVPAQSYFSTEISTSGQAVIEILWAEEVVTVTESVTATATVVGKRNKRHLHKHRNNGA